MAAVADPAFPVSPPILLDEPGDPLSAGYDDRFTDDSGSPPLTATATGFNLPPSSSLKANLSSQTNEPVLVDIQANHPSIDYVGRWDASKTARWCGSSIRFAFTGSLLLFTPGKKTVSTAFPTLGWTVEDAIGPSGAASISSRRVYTATAKPDVSIRLWPPEGRLHTQVYNSDNDRDSPPRSADQTREQESTVSTAHKKRIVELTLVDWGSTLQCGSFQVLFGHKLVSPYAVDGQVVSGALPSSSSPICTSIQSPSPGSAAAVPTLLFIGDSLTTGFVYSSSKMHEAGYCGFLESYPSQLRALLDSPTRAYGLAMPGIALVDSDDGDCQDGMQSKFFRRGPLEPNVDDRTYRSPTSSYHLISLAANLDPHITSVHSGESSDWDFDASPASDPTHIFIQLGTNDHVPADLFAQTYNAFLSLLKETYGRRTGDIFVLSPFGTRKAAAMHGDPDAKVVYASRYSELENVVRSLAEKWALDDQDPMQSGRFPETPVLEMARFNLAGGSSFASSNKQGAPTSVAPPNSFRSPQSSPQPASLQVPQSPRPSLVVRPSSLEVASNTSAKGTNTRLHFVNTSGWLDEQSDTFDPTHPTRKGAQKIGRRLCEWLVQGGFVKI